MENIFVYCSLFILLFACILIMSVIIKKTFSVITVYEYEKGLRYYKGKLVKVLEAGQYWFLPLSTSIEKIDLRPAFTTLAAQEVLTAESIPVKISIVADYQVVDVVTAVNKNESYQEALYMLLQLTLRKIVSSVKIKEIIEKREYISGLMMQDLKVKENSLGIMLNSINIKDITFSGELKRAFIQVVQAQQEGLAKLEKTRGESAALRNLANAAKVFDDNPHLMQLRILQALDETSGNTVVLNMSNENISIPKRDIKD
jgi:regulator of protease activity HflC (stomatin/prohibitin superfamily)